MPCVKNVFFPYLHVLAEVKVLCGSPEVPRHGLLQGGGGAPVGGGRSVVGPVARRGVDRRGVAWRGGGGQLEDSPDLLSLGVNRGRHGAEGKLQIK